jgi:hypothetical protein
MIEHILIWMVGYIIEYISVIFIYDMIPPDMVG